MMNLKLLELTQKKLCRFKSHFNPSIQLYFSIEKENIIAKFAKIARAYDLH